MVFEHIEQLKRRFTDRFVVVASDRPDLARFRNTTGQIKTINMNGRALVEFDSWHNNIGWYDISLEHLQILDKPPLADSASGANVAADTGKASVKDSPAPASAASQANGKSKTADILAAARNKKSTAKPLDDSAIKAADKKKLPTTDILAAARQAKSSKLNASAPSTKPPGTAGQKLSTADILAAARGKKGVVPATGPAAEKTKTSGPQKLDIAAILAEARAEKGIAGPSVAVPGNGGFEPQKLDHAAVLAEARTQFGIKSSPAPLKSDGFEPQKLDHAQFLAEARAQFGISPDAKPKSEGFEPQKLDHAAVLALARQQSGMVEETPQSRSGGTTTLAAGTADVDTATPVKKLSTAEILAQARANKSALTQGSASDATKPAGTGPSQGSVTLEKKKLTTAEILAAARANKAATSANASTPLESPRLPDEKVHASVTPKDVTTSGAEMPANRKLTTAEIIAAIRASKKK